MPAGSSQSGSASVEHAALVLLMAAVVCGVVAALAIGPDKPDGSLASAIAFKQRCAVRYPDPCWEDSLTEAYGRSVAGAVRALAPPPEARTGPGGESIVGVDYRRCRQPSCAIPAGSRLTTAGRRATAFTAIDDRRRADGLLGIDYWIYRPTLGWELIHRELGTAELGGYATTPLLDSADPALVPLETLLGRDDARFRAGEDPPWRNRIESRWGR